MPHPPVVDGENPILPIMVLSGPCSGVHPRTRIPPTLVRLTGSFYVTGVPADRIKAVNEVANCAKEVKEIGGFVGRSLGLKILIGRRTPLVALPSLGALMEGFHKRHALIELQV